LIIGAKNEQIIEKGMSFLYVIGFKDVSFGDSNKKFAVQIADTLLMASDDNPEILTQEISFNHKNVSYIYDDVEKKDDTIKNNTDRKKEKGRKDSAMPSTSTKRTRSGLQSSNKEIHQYF
jgi:nucleosome binding factor SPN SPT16 subunit